MFDDAEHFRSRADECRRLAMNARYPEDKRILMEMAEELDEEANTIATQVSQGNDHDR